MIILGGCSRGPSLSEEIRARCPKPSRVGSFWAPCGDLVQKLKARVYHDEQARVLAVVPIHDNPEQRTLIMPDIMLIGLRAAMVASNLHLLKPALADDEISKEVHIDSAQFPRYWPGHLVQ